VLVVLENYPSKVKYKYLKKEVEVSTLLVNKESLINDAEVASLGEFVAGRLLNVYESLKGKEFIKRVEISFKRRVVLEILDEIISNYGILSTDFIIPIEYFLFEKLKKRMTIYPPALYSYIKTYEGDLGKENLEISLRAFNLVFNELEKQNLITLIDGNIRINKKCLMERKPSKISSAVKYTKRGLTSYAVHGYAGMVGPDIIRREIMSKISRSRHANDVPKELDHPKNSWKIKEGLLVIDKEDWLHEVIINLGLEPEVKVTSKRLGEFYQTSNIFILDGSKKSVSIVVKRFRDFRFVKWALLNVWTLPAKFFKISPLERLHREYNAVLKLKEVGLHTPEIISMVANSRILVTRFIEGVNLSKVIDNVLNGIETEIQSVYLFGKTLRFVHDRKYALGDTKPNNIILAGKKIFLTDLEQADENGDQSWDIAEFLYYSNKLSLNLQAAKKVTESFLDGYLEHGITNIIRKALNTKYIVPFQALLDPTIIKMIREEMHNRIK
jgi:tRNA A-37 threonylcarbamoyl transferase component Bud32